MTAVISVEHLAKAYGDSVAVRDVSFEVRPGEVFGLLGPNGAGKTTSVECVQGLRSADSGRIEVLGFDPRTQSDHLRPLIGAQLQESSLPRRLKVAEALQLFSALQPQGPPWRSVMREWDLQEKASTTFENLSGGQRQRLLVALALVNAPRVVFLDEMTTGLDPAARRATWGLIERIRREGTTVVLVTHFMDEAERLCDRLAVIDRGEVVATGTPAQLVADHADGVTIRFTGPTAPLEALRGLPGVEQVEQRGGVVQVVGESGIVAGVGKVLADAGLHPDDIDVRRPSLEDVYLALVGRGEP